MGSSELIPCFALLAHMAFALPIKISLSQAMSFLTFTLQIPTGEGGSEWLGGAELSAGFNP